MMFDMVLPNLRRRYAIAGSVFGALVPAAFCCGRMPVGSTFVDHLSNLFLDPCHLAVTLACAAAAGMVSARAGRKFDRIGRLLVAERAGIAELYHTAYHDALTGLGNRHALHRDLGALPGLGSDGAVAGVLMLIDLDRFKRINDTMGHAAGDEVLVVLARRIRKVAAAGTRIYRLGGDEFVILSEGPQERTAVEAWAGRLAANVFRPVPYSGVEIETSGSIGITFLGSEECHLSTALNRADLAMYAAKATAGPAHRFYADELERDAQSRRRVGRHGARVSTMPCSGSSAVVASRKSA